MSSTVPGSEIWVVKVGSSLVTAEGQGLNDRLIDRWVGDIVKLLSRGIRVVLVSSGAVAEGMARLGLMERPKAIAQLQAAAAVGQMGLIQHYQTSFDQHKVKTAQVLLTDSDLSARDRYLNARNTLINLLALGVVPIVNENDTVVTDEIRFGDNDRLAARVANLLDATRLVLMTDQPGLFEQDPRVNSTAQIIPMIAASDTLLDSVAGEGGKWGRGGMISKVQAARIAARSGCQTSICSGTEPNILNAIMDGETPGTLIHADKPIIGARKQWLSSLTSSGVLRVDAGAAKALLGGGKSLLAVGITAIEGEFGQGALVSCQGPTGQEICRGLTNYASNELLKIKGRNTQAIESELGFAVDEEVIHRDDMWLVS